MERFPLTASNLAPKLLRQSETESPADSHNDQEERCAKARTPSAARMITIPAPRKRLLARETLAHSPVRTPAVLLVTMIMPMSKGHPTTMPSVPILEMPNPYNVCPPNQKTPISAPQAQPIPAPDRAKLLMLLFLKSRYPQ